MAYPKRLFLIDDDEDDCLFFNLALSGLKYEGEFFFHHDGGKALEHLSSSFLPDIIFLDWNMPKMDGRACLVEIRKLSFYKSLPIIIISTSTATTDKQEAYNLGATYFLSKPDSISELQNRLQQIFKVVWDNKSLST